ncbi:MAG: flavodoxin family protein [Chloroflexota bacterium]
MRLLALNGSPRRGGNTEILLNEALRGAESQKAETHLIVLNDLKISPCQHCDACLKEGRCRIQDDMQMVYSELEKADRVVLGSPLHFMGLTAQMKLMIDRCQALWSRKYQLKVPPLGDRKERKGLFVAVSGRGGTSTSLFESALVTVKTLYLTLDIKYTGALLFPGVDEKGAIKNVPGALAQAFRAGKDFVS